MTSPLPPDSSRKQVVDRWLIVALVMYVYARVAVPFVVSLPRPLSDILSSVLLVTLALLVAIRAASVRWGGVWTKALALFSTGAGFAFSYVVLRPLTGGHWLVEVLGDVFQIGMASAAGVLIAEIVREAKLLPAAVATAVVLDVLGVHYGGPVAYLLEKRPDIVESLSQKIPIAGSAASPHEPGEAPEVSYLATAGIGDLVFVAFFFACVARFGMNYRLTLAITLALAAVAICMALTTGMPVPALLFLAIGTLVCNLRYFRYTRSEGLALVCGALFLVVICGLMIYVSSFFASQSP